MKIDCVIATIPKIQFRSPIIGPAQLKACLEEQGFKCRTVDWNIALWHTKLGRKHPEWWLDSDLVFRYRDRFENKWHLIEPYVKEWIDQLLELNPDWFGISIFSQRSVFMATKICQELRSRKTKIKIVIGGPYVNYCGEHFFENNYCDAFIKGDGEEALISLLKNNNHPGINGWSPQLDDLENLPIPDYSDFDLSLYPKTYRDPSIYDPSQFGAELIYITGSRGCVRRCTFCDVPFQWPKFRYRSGQSIANEMLHQYNSYGISKFYFTDSLVNGSIKMLKDLCQTLINAYKEGTPKFYWQGQFICRPKNQMPPEIYDLMKEAGFEYIAMGVESISEKVRKDMRKNFSNEDLYYTLEQCSRAGIKVALLMMVGYPTETSKDFEESLDFFRKNLQYLEDGTIHDVTLGPTTELVQGAPLYEQKENWNIHYDELGHWYCDNNTMEIRIERYIKFHNLITELGYSLTAKTVEHLEEELIRIRKTSC